MPRRFAILISVAMLWVTSLCIVAAQDDLAPTSPWQPPLPQNGSGRGVSQQAPAASDNAPAAAAHDSQPEEAPGFSMVPHSENPRYWISGQANTIAQVHGRFYSPYQGLNSLIDDFELKQSEVTTLYFGYQLRPNSRYSTDLILDFENAGGRGISQALGLAGATNLDVVRNPSLSSAPYFARGEIHQVIGLTDNMVEQDRGPLALASRVPARRFEIRIGKFALPDSFDLNTIGSDSHMQFTNWTIDNNGAWDYAADTRGYTVGGILEYDDRAWSARYGIAAMPTVANGDTLDWAFGRASGQNWEFELRKGPLSQLLNPKRKGAIRILAYRNHAHMGDYRKSVEEYLNGQASTPQITATERFGAVKYGFGVNFEQQLTSSLRIFGRFGWNPDRHESFAYTEVAQTFVFGGDHTGQAWKRPNDKAGLAFVSNAIKRDHQNYLHYGGLGFLLGDGGLNYGRENDTEWYYNAHVWRGLFGMIGGTYIVNPGYNRGRGPVYVGTTRLHIDF